MLRASMRLKRNLSDKKEKREDMPINADEDIAEGNTLLMADIGILMSAAPSTDFFSIGAHRIS